MHERLMPTPTPPSETMHGIGEVYRERTTLEKIIGNDKPKIEDPLGLLTAAVDVRIFESQQTLFYRVNFPNTALYGQDFIKLLIYAGHNPSPSYSQDREGIVGDWILPDQKDEDSKKRHERHKQAFDPYYSDFVEQHRIAFMNAVSPLSQEEVRGLFSTQAGKLISTEQAVSELHTLVKGYDPIVKYSLWNKYKSLESWLKDTQQSITRNSLVGLGGEDVIRLIIELPPHLRRILVNDNILSRDRNVVDVQGMAGRVKNGGDGLDGPKHRYSIYHHGGGNVEITDETSWMKLSFEDGIFKVMHTYVITNNDNALSPSILWSKDNNNKRNYLSSDIPAQLLQDTSKNANTLLGLIAAAYLSPEQRDQLPEELGYKEAAYIAETIHSVGRFSELNARLHAGIKSDNVRNKQKMMEAQRPLLLLSYANVLVNEIPLFQKVEALYPK